MKYKSAQCEFDGETLTVYTKKPGKFSVPEMLYHRLIKEIDSVKVVEVISNDYIDFRVNGVGFKKYLNEATKSQKKGTNSNNPPYYTMNYR